MQNIYDNYSEKDQDDIATDFELAILESLNGKGSSKANYITMDDIQRLIDRIGLIDDRRVLSKEEFALLESNKIYKNPKKRFLTGLLAGYADFFNIPIWVLRTAFLLALTLSSGWAIFYYVIFSILTPSPYAYTQNVISEFKSSSHRIKPVWFFERIATFGRALLPIGGRAAGKLLQIAGYVMDPYLIITATGLIMVRFLNLPTNWVYSSFLEIYDSRFGDILFNLLIVFWTVLWVCVWLLACHVGSNLWRLKGIGSSRVIVSLIGLIFLMSILTFSAEGLVDEYSLIDKNAAQSTKVWKDTEFDSVDLPLDLGIDTSRRYNVIIERSDQKSIGITGKRGVVSNLTVDNVPPTVMANSYGLNLANINQIYPFRTYLYCNQADITIYIKTPKLRRLRVNSQNRVTAIGFGQPNQLTEQLQGDELNQKAIVFVD